MTKLKKTWEDIYYASKRRGDDPCYAMFLADQYIERKERQARKMAEKEYDATPVIQAHIKRVQELLQEAISNLTVRAAHHDLSKFAEPEKSALDMAGPPGRVMYSEGGEVTPGYQQSLAVLEKMREHHYAVADHHPEHWPNGINDMSLLSILEMLCDWRAAGELYKDGNIAASLRTNRMRFNISDQLYSILENTVKELGW